MGVFAWATDQIAQRVVKRITGNPAGWNVLGFQEGRPYSPTSNYAQLVQKYTGWVYACAHINAISCAQIPLRLYVRKRSKNKVKSFCTVSVPHLRKAYLLASPSTTKFMRMAEDVEEVLEHPFIDLMNSVNEQTNEFDLKEATFLYQDLTGNAYWVIQQESAPYPMRIWPLMPQYVKIVPSKEKFIERFEYSIAFGEKHLIDPEEMIHFRFVNPMNAFYGYGPLQAAVIAADLSVGMDTLEAALMNNRGVPDSAIILPPEAGVPNEEVKQRMKADWRKNFGGIRKQGKLAILSGGADVKSLQLTPREMSFLAGRKATLNEIAAIFGVPMSKLTVENVNRANAEAGEYQYMKDTVLPRLRKVEQKMNEQLLPRFGDNLFVAFDNPVPRDRDYRLKELEVHAKTGYTSINEERQREGLEEVEWGNVPIMPVTVAPLGSAPSPPPKQVKAPRTIPPMGHPTNFINENMVKALQVFYRKMEAELLMIFDRDFKSYQKSELELADFFANWFNTQKWQEEMHAVTSVFMRYTMMSAAGRAIKIKPGAVWDVNNPRAVSALEKHRTGRVVGLVETQQKQLRKTLADGMAANEAPRQIRKRIQSEFDDMNRYGAGRIARTETIWAHNEGAQMGWAEGGVTKKQWVSSGDPRSCAYCTSMNGKIVDVEGSYFRKGDNMRNPEQGNQSLSFNYDGIEHPPLHPNCRCTIVPIIEGI